MNISLKWYKGFVWLGVLINLTFVVPALFSPASYTNSIGLPYADSYEWMKNAGMLVFTLSIFYVVLAHASTTYYKLNWLNVLSRVIASLFWIHLIKTSNFPDAFHNMLLVDASLSIILAVLLQGGLPDDMKLTWRDVWGIFTAPIRWVLSKLKTPVLRFSALGVLLVVIFIGYQLYANLLKPYPEEYFEKDEDQFKHGAIGLSMTYRIPYYIFKVLPQIFKEKLPDKGAGEYRSVGLIYEEGHELPVGLAKRHIGFKSVEPNCAFCHTGSYKKFEGDKQRLMLGGPAHELDLEGFQWFLYDCAADQRFNPDTVMAYIDKIADMSFTERTIYKNLIIPFTKSSLKKQATAYSWQKKKPLQGKGRTDTFNPTKFNVFHFPYDQTIGTVDLPQVWNQRPREGLYLHWDGNNNSLQERNYAAAMAVGATPSSVIPVNFNRVTNFLLDLQPAPYPFEIDQELAALGKPIYDEHCASCHEFGQPLTGHVTLLEDIKTDPNRLFSFTTHTVDRFHEFTKEPFLFNAYRKTYGYSNTPLDGIWGRAPYLHNGSVPTLHDLLQAPENRPDWFYKGYNVYDSLKMGFVHDTEEAKKVGFKLETNLRGNGNQGHLYGTELDDSSKTALLEYLKTL